MRKNFERLGTRKIQVVINFTISKPRRFLFATTSSLIMSKKVEIQIHETGSIVQLLYFVRYAISLTSTHAGVHEVSLQFRKFVTKTIDETSLSDSFHALGCYQGFYHVAFHVPC